MTDSGWFYWLLGFWHFQLGCPGLSQAAEKLLIFFITADSRWWQTLSDNANDVRPPQGALLVLTSWWGSCYRYCQLWWWWCWHQPLLTRGYFHHQSVWLSSCPWPEGWTPPPQTRGANIWSWWPSLWAVGKNTRGVPAALMVPLWSHWDHYVEIESLDTKQHQTTSVHIRQSVTINWRCIIYDWFGNHKEN